MDIKIPDNPDFLANLALQRTDFFLQLGGREQYRHWRQTGDKQNLLKDIIDAGKFQDFLKLTLKQISQDYFLFKEFVQDIIPKPQRFVSIGVGNGIMELFLYKDWGFDAILLIDIEETPENYQQIFTHNGAGYASLKSTKDFLVMNGVPSEKIILCNPKKTILPAFPFDCLFSLLSMGFHYPCDEYLSFILDNKMPNAALILDSVHEGYRYNTIDKGLEALKTMMPLYKSVAQKNRDRIGLKSA